MTFRELMYDKWFGRCVIVTAIALVTLPALTGCAGFEVGVSAYIQRGYPPVVDGSGSEVAVETTEERTARGTKTTVTEMQTNERGLRLQ